MRLIHAGRLRDLLKECQRLFEMHHSDRCGSCGAQAPSMDEKEDKLYFEHAVRSTLAKELHWISVWQNYEG